MVRVIANVRSHMVASAFATIEEKDWLLAHGTPKHCRTLLHGRQPFETIIRQLCSGIEVIEVHRNKAKSCPGYFRAQVRVRVHRDRCAVFHSGRSGYRAQYYKSVANGERANAFAVSSITRAISSDLRDTRLMSKKWIERSLLGRDSKVWIHQGQWLRQWRRIDRLLVVKRWNREVDSDDAKRRKLAVWASLVPQYEDRIDIKGSFLTLDGEPLSANPKQGRSEQLYELGFT